jgi:hypothetical protein
MPVVGHDHRITPRSEMGAIHVMAICRVVFGMFALFALLVGGIACIGMTNPDAPEFVRYEFAWIVGICAIVFVVFGTLAMRDSK